MPLLRRKTVLAAEIEATAYTAETLAAADSNFNVFDAVCTPTIENRERAAANTFSQRQGSAGPRMGTVTFRTDITGDGAGGVPTWASEFLPACGWVDSSGTFSPTSEAPGSNVKTLTIGVYEDGRRKLLRGCMGTFKIVLETGKDAVIDWTFTGAWGGVTDVAILAPTYPTDRPLRFANSATTIAAYAPCVQKLEIDAGNNVIMRECQNASDASGYKGAIVTDRKVVGTLDPEAELVATYDCFGKWLASTEEALAVVMQDSTDQVTLTMPKAEITGIQDGDRNSLRTDPITFKGNLSSSGDDEFTIAFAAAP